VILCRAAQKGDAASGDLAKCDLVARRPYGVSTQASCAFFDQRIKARSAEHADIGPQSSSYGCDSSVTATINSWWPCSCVGTNLWYKVFNFASQSKSTRSRGFSCSKPDSHNLYLCSASVALDDSGSDARAAHERFRLESTRETDHVVGSDQTQSAPQVSAQ